MSQTWIAACKEARSALPSSCRPVSAALLPPEIGQARREEGACAVRARLDENSARLWLDLAGTPLHRRGYRLAGGRAPLRENLAAALLRAGGGFPRAYF